MRIVDYFLGFDGRIGRLSYLGGSLAATLMLGVAVVGVIGAADAGFGALGLGLAVAAGLLAIWSSLCLQIKRLHDRDQSGWWLLVNFLPFGQLYLAVVTLFLRGSDGGNRFGGPDSGGFAGGDDSIDPGGRDAWSGRDRSRDPAPAPSAYTPPPAASAPPARAAVVQRGGPAAFGRRGA